MIDRILGHSSQVVDWLIKNRKWVFDGFGVVIATAVVSFFWKGFQRVLRRGTPSKETGGVQIGGVQGGIHGAVITGRGVINNWLDPSQSEERYQRVLLDEVKSFWVKDVLEKSLYHPVLIELGMEKRLDVVEYPWDMVVQKPDPPSSPLPPRAPRL